MAFIIFLPHYMPATVRFDGPLWVANRYVHDRGGEHETITFTNTLEGAYKFTLAYDAYRFINGNAGTIVFAYTGQRTIENSTPALPTPAPTLHPHPLPPPATPSHTIHSHTQHPHSRHAHSRHSHSIHSPSRHPHAMPPPYRGPTVGG